MRGVEEKTLLPTGPVTPAEKQVIALHLNGYGYGAIADLTGGSTRAVSATLRSKKVAELLGEISELYRLELAALLRPAIAAVGKALESGSPAVALKAADMVFNSQGIYKGVEGREQTAEDVIKRALEVVTTVRVVER